MRQQQLETGTLAREDAVAATESAELDGGGATTTFEERTVWNLTDVSSFDTRVSASFYAIHVFDRFGFFLFC